MTKNELIETIQSMPDGEFELVENFTPPPASFDLPDVRTCAIYPPSPYKIQNYQDHWKREFALNMVFNSNTSH